MSHSQLYEQSEMDYSNASNRREVQSKSATRRAPLGRRRGKSPTSVNGIHRRRNRKINW